MIGHQKGGFSIESAETATALNNGTSEFKNNLVHAVAKPFFANTGSTSVFADDVALQAFLTNGANNNTKLDSANQAMLTDPWSLTAPNFTPKVGSMANLGASYNGLDGFFAPGQFVGAFGSDNWLNGWTNFDPNNADY
jgi:hypothetical protein